MSSEVCNRLVQVFKYHGDGNDFVVVDSGAVPQGRRREFARAVCRPHIGLGADGVVFLERAGDGTFQLRIFNRDGSEAGMSGNGARSAAAFVHQHGLTSERHLQLATRAGTRLYSLLESSHSIWTFRSEMGLPLFRPEQVPCRAPSGCREVLDYQLRVRGEPVRIHALSMGNPQCVLLVPRLPGQESFQKLGRGLERHPFFPERTNVSFVSVQSPHSLKIRIWERGVGPTLASGTGACAAAVAAIRAGVARSPLRVWTRSGSQQVAWSPGRPVILTGRAVFVCSSRFFWRGEKNPPDQTSGVSPETEKVLDQTRFDSSWSEE